MIDGFRAQARLLAGVRCPADARIEAYLQDHFRSLGLPFSLRLPEKTVILGCHGIARELSLPSDRNEFSSHPGAPSWRLIGTVGTGTFCHKPCTVSGGGKSER